MIKIICDSLVQKRPVRVVYLKAIECYFFALDQIYDEANWAKEINGYR